MPENAEALELMGDADSFDNRFYVAVRKPTEMQIVCVEAIDRPEKEREPSFPRMTSRILGPVALFDRYTTVDPIFVGSNRGRNRCSQASRAK
jgi:hypothetical protein